MVMKAFYAYKDGPGDVPTNMGTIGSLTLPPGAYVIFAKVVVAQGSGDPKKVTQNQVTARLEAGNQFDTCVTLLGLAMSQPEFASNAASMALNVATKEEFRKNGGTVVVKLDKKPNGTPFVEWVMLKITAISVDELNSSAIP